MSDKVKARIHTVYGLSLSFAIVLTGLLLIVECLSIYYSGEAHPFTPERVTEALTSILFSVIPTLLLLIGGIVLSFLLPREKEKPRAILDRAALLARLEKRIDCSAPAYAAVARKEGMLRILFSVGAAALSYLAAIPALIRLLQFDVAFPYPGYNEAIIAFLPSLALFSATLVTSVALCLYLRNASYKRQTKAAHAHSNGKQTAAAHTYKGALLHCILVWLARAAVLCTALLLLAIGLFGGGMGDVLSKAINICTECIGLG